MIIHCAIYLTSAEFFPTALPSVSLHDDCMPIPHSRCPVGRSVVSLAGVRKSVLRAGDKNELGIISEPNSLS